MMDTVLNLGLNDSTVVALAELTGNERFAWDAYRRFIMMFSSVVLNIEKISSKIESTPRNNASALRAIPKLMRRHGRSSLQILKPSLKSMQGGHFRKMCVSS